MIVSWLSTTQWIWVASFEKMLSLFFVEPRTIHVVRRLSFWVIHVNYEKLSKAVSIA